VVDVGRRGRPFRLAQFGRELLPVLGSHAFTFHVGNDTGHFPLPQAESERFVRGPGMDRVAARLIRSDSSLVTPRLILSTQAPNPTRRHPWLVQSESTSAPPTRSSRSSKVENPPSSPTPKARAPRRRSSPSPRTAKSSP